MDGSLVSGYTSRMAQALMGPFCIKVLLIFTRPTLPTHTGCEVLNMRFRRAC